MVRRLSFFFILCILLVSGCASHLSLTVDSIGAPSRDTRYVILPGMDGVRNDDLFFVEYKRELAQLLTSMNYEVTENEANASAAVMLSWFTELLAGSSSGARMGIGMGAGGFRRGPSMGVGMGFPVGGSAPSTVRRHQVSLDAYSFAPGAENPVGQNLWKVILVATDEESNLRMIFPLMMEAARPYIGNDSHGPVNISVPKKKQD